MPDRDLPEGYEDQLDMEGAGALTFLNRPLLHNPSQLDAWEPDVAIVGAPFDINVTNKPGAKYGPRSIRALADFPGTYHLDLGIEIFDHVEVVDYGDAYCPHGQSDPGLANIQTRVGEIASRGIFPMIVGGDHSITWPAASAVAESVGWGKVGIIHFDAHADTANILEGNLASHGTPMRRLIESGAVLGRNFIQVGLRGYWPPEDDFRWMQEQEMRWHLMNEIWERGSQAVIDDAIEEAMDGCDAIYLSVDVDVLDPGFAPGTGTPEPGGMNPADLLRAVRKIALETNLVAMDVVEVSPPYDHAEQTVNNAQRVMLEVLAGLAVRKRGSGADPVIPTGPKDPTGA